MIYFFIFITSACIASFLNVVLDRHETAESIVFKPSYCFNCKNKIRWWQNVPIISYLLLKGKCFFCKINIPKYHFLLELLFPVFIVLFSGFVFYKFPEIVLPRVFLLVLFVILLIFLSLFDLRYRLIPHQVTYTAIVIFVLAGLLYDDHKLDPFINIGIAFLFLDLLNMLISVLKKYTSDQNLIVFPVFLWTLYFLLGLNHSFYLIFLPVLAYFILVKLDFNIKSNYFSILWIVNLLLILFLVLKNVFIDFDFHTIFIYFAGVGCIYFICEVVFYLFTLLVPGISNTCLQNYDKEEKIALGGGDITVFALISAFLGYKLAFLSLFTASLLAIISHLFWLIVCRFLNYLKSGPNVSKNIPFVPYLMIACFIIILIAYE